MIWEYLSSSFMDGSETCADVLIQCQDGFIPTHRLVLASSSEMLSSIFRSDTWDEQITIILPDFNSKEVSNCLKEFYKNGSNTTNNVAIANVLRLTRPNFMKLHDAVIAPELGNRCEKLTENLGHVNTENKTDLKDNNEIEIKVEESHDDDFLSEDVRLDEDQDHARYLPIVEFHERDICHEFKLDCKVEEKYNEQDFVSLVECNKSNKKKGGSLKNSVSRQFFEIDEENRAHCKICGYTTTNSTALFLRHLKKKHLDVFKTLNLKKSGRKKLNTEESHRDEVEVQESFGKKTKLPKIKKVRKEMKKTSEYRKHFDNDEEGKVNCKLCGKKLVDRAFCMQEHLRFNHTDVFILVKKKAPGRPQPRLYSQYFSEVPDNPAKVLCSLCNTTYSPNNIIRHINNVHSIFEGGKTKKDYICTFCGKTFKNNWNRQKHENLIHLKIEKGKSENKEDDVQLHQCSGCGKQFKSWNSLDLHEKRGVCKSDPETLKCPTCDKQFTNRGKYLLHIKRSSLCSGENIMKAFPCHYCEGSFTTLTFLQKHLRIHTGETPYQCEFCSRKFKFLHRLTFHKSKCGSGSIMN